MAAEPERHAFNEGGTATTARPLHSCVECRLYRDRIVAIDADGNLFLTDVGLHTVQKRTPQGRWGRTPDMAGVAAFLASPASDFVTGTAIPVDGGFSIAM